VAVQDKALKTELRSVAWDQPQVSDAGVIFVMCADLNAHNIDPQKIWGHAPQAVQDILGPMTAPFYAGKERLIRDEGIRSSGLAGMTLMLAAHDRGYDSCPTIGFDADAVGKLINLPADHMVSFIITAGKKTQPAWDRGPCLPNETVLIHDRFPA